MSDQNLDLMIEPEAIAILDHYGIPYPANRFVQNADEAVWQAEQIGYPVVLKIVSPRIIHKSDAGGVMAELKDGEAVRAGYEDMIYRIGKAMPSIDIQGVLVCRQADPGLEVIVGASEDPVFGPTLMFGMGGIYTEILNDVSFRIVPVESLDVEEMIQEIKGYHILSGTRGKKPRDLKALANIIQTVGRIVSERPEIKEIDLNPVRLYEGGLLVLDARIYRVK